MKAWNLHESWLYKFYKQLIPALIPAKFFCACGRSAVDQVLHALARSFIHAMSKALYLATTSIIVHALIVTH